MSNRKVSPFKIHCIAIVKASQRSADTFANVAIFVLATIQQQFNAMPIQMDSFKRDGINSRFLFGVKRQGYAFIQENKVNLWRQAKRFTKGEISLEQLIIEYMAIPGLGITKASFLAQMTVADGACLDSHNLRRLGLSETQFRLAKGLKVETVLQKIKAYNAVWQSVGDSAYWWDSWCEYLANKRTGTWRSALHVSETHMHAIGNERKV